MLIVSTRFRVQESKTPLGVMPAESKLGPAELLRAFKQANPQVWAIKDKQVCPSSCICAETHPLTLTHLPCLRRRARRC